MSYLSRSLVVRLYGLVHGSAWVRCTTAAQDALRCKRIQTVSL